MRPGSEDRLICQITSALHLVLVVKAEVFNFLQTKLELSVLWHSWNILKVEFGEDPIGGCA